ncbi:MAG: hypothetical protein CL862_00010 [Cyanobium sp. NAT70]|nr:hypothetical protein [Cyanobium sp. NAT70]
MSPFFDLLAQSSRNSHSSSRSTNISIEQHELAESVTSQLIASGLPIDVAEQVFSFSDGFGFGGRGRGGRRGGGRHHGHHHGGHHDGGRGHHHHEPAVEDSPSIDEIATEPPVEVISDLPPVIEEVITPVESVSPPALEVVEDVVEQPIDETPTDPLSEYEEENFEIDPDDLETVLDEIDLDELALADDDLSSIDQGDLNDIAAGNTTLTLAQIQQLFEVYFSTINNVNNTTTNNISNTTTNYIDNSIDQSTVINDNSVVNDNSVNNINIDNSDNSVNDSGNVYNDNSIHDSNNTYIDNSVSSFVLNRQVVNLSNMITGDRYRGGEAVRGTRDDDVIGAGPGRDRLVGRRGADSFVFDDFGQCGKRNADVIKDFSAREGDRILLDSQEFSGDGSLGVAETRKDFRQLRKASNFDFLYDQLKGRLYFNENGDERGFGDGGLLAAFKGAPELSAEHIGMI